MTRREYYFDSHRVEAHVVVVVIKKGFPSLPNCRTLILHEAAADVGLSFSSGQMSWCPSSQQDKGPVMTASRRSGVDNGFGSRTSVSWWFVGLITLDPVLRHGPLKTTCS